MRQYILFILVAFFTNSYSIPATPYPVTVEQADGSKLNIYLHGDEFYHYKTTLDGYLLLPNDQGILSYAIVDNVGNLTNTYIKANNKEQRSKVENNFIKKLNTYQNHTHFSEKRLNKLKFISSKIRNHQESLTIGSYKSLVILVNFSDLTFVTPYANYSFDKLLNEPRYSDNNVLGSAKDYFISSSDSIFNPDFVIVGPYNLPKNMSFYGRNDINGYDVNPQQMVIDACKLAYINGVDFSEFDNNNDGIVDNVFVYYAGHNEAEGASANSIWPHRWNLKDLNFQLNGKIIYDYACSSELRSNYGSEMCGIGTFVHEFGHVLGLPDLYATDDTKNHFTLSSWDVMDMGSYLNNGRTPPTYSSYERFFLNWLSPTILKSPISSSLTPLLSNNTAYLISPEEVHNIDGRNPEPNEFYLLENRQNKGWDTYLPYHGLLITHVKFDSYKWNNNDVNNNPDDMGVQIIAADNVSNKSTFEGDPFPGIKEVTTCHLKLKSGNYFGKVVTDIKELKNEISFIFKDVEPPVALPANDITPYSFIANWNSLPEITEYSLDVFTENDKKNYILKNYIVTDTLYSLINLSPNEDIYYQVKGFNKIANINTDYSNIIRLKTLYETSSLMLTVSSDKTTIFIYIPSTNDSLFIYDAISGLLIKNINSDSNIIEVKNLPINKPLIIKSGKRYAKVILK